MTGADSLTLPAHEVAVRGFAVLPGWLPQRWSDALVAGLDRLWRERPGQKRLMPHEPFIALLADPLLDRLVAPVLGCDYLFHHANGMRITDGAGKVWHHDFDGIAAWDGATGTTMVHVMMYPAGISGDNGPLVVRPGSHRHSSSRHHPNRFGYDTQAGDVTVTGPPGTVVLVNSALWHMRPASAGTRARHYLNFSFFGLAPLPRPERERYSDLFAALPQAVPAGAGRDRLTRLCRPHTSEPRKGA